MPFTWDYWFSPPKPEDPPVDDDTAITIANILKSRMQRRVPTSYRDPIGTRGLTTVQQQAQREGRLIEPSGVGQLAVGLAANKYNYTGGPQQWTDWKTPGQDVRLPLLGKRRIDVKGLLDLGVSAATDPTTFVGAPAGARAAKAVGKEAKRLAPDVGRAIQDVAEQGRPTLGAELGAKAGGKKPVGKVTEPVIKPPQAEGLTASPETKGLFNKGATAPEIPAVPGVQTGRRPPVTEGAFATPEGQKLLPRGRNIAPSVTPSPDVIPLPGGPVSGAVNFPTSRTITVGQPRPMQFDYAPEVNITRRGEAPVAPHQGRRKITQQIQPPSEAAEFPTRYGVWRSPEIGVTRPVGYKPTPNAPYRTVAQAAGEAPAPPARSGTTGGGKPPIQPPVGVATQPSEIPEWMAKGYDFARDHYDRIYPFTKVQQYAQGTAYNQAKVVPAAVAAGEDIVRRNYFPALRHVGTRDVKNLEDYMVLSRSRDFLESGRATIVPGGYRTVADIDVKLAALDRKMGRKAVEVRRSADDLWRANIASVVDPLEQEGILSEVGAMAMRQQGQHYIDFHRLDYVLDDVATHFGSKAEASLSGTGIHRLSETGSAKVLDKPLARFISQPIKAQVAIARNKAAKALVNDLQTIDPHFAQRLRPDEAFTSTQDWGVISFFENGQKVRVKVPRPLEVAAKGLDAEDVGLIGKVGSALSRPLVSGATKYNPGFALVVNPIMDVTSAFFRTGLKPFSPDHIKGIVAAITKNSNFSDAAQDGALMAGFIENLTKPESMASKAAFGAIPLRSVGDFAKFLPRLVAEAGQTSERSTRIAVYLRQKRLGDTGLQAAVAARDATIDFAKAGNVGRQINRIIPFYNATIQGNANIARLVRQNPKWAMIAATPFGMISLLSWANNRQYETRDMISESEHGRSWVFIIGEGTKADGTKYPIRVKIPKGPLGAGLTLPFEAGILFAERRGGVAANDLFQMMSSVVTSASPVELSAFGWMPPVGATAAQIGANYDAYRNAPIVPESEQGRLPAMQYGPDTPRWAVGAGKLTGTAPRKWDFAVRDYLAGMGQIGSYAADKAAQAAGYNPTVYGEAFGKQLTPTEQLSRTPVISRFLGTSSGARSNREWKQLRAAVSETQEQIYAVPELTRLGVPFGTVGDTIAGLELTPTQRAKYQSKTAEYALPELEREIAKPEYRLRTDEKKRQYLSAIIGLARQQAAGDVVREMDPKDRGQQLINSPQYQQLPTFELKRQAIQQTITPPPAATQPGKKSWREMAR